MNSQYWSLFSREIALFWRKRRYFPSPITPREGAQKVGPEIWSLERKKVTLGRVRGHKGWQHQYILTIHGIYGSKSHEGSGAHSAFQISKKNKIPISRGYFRLWRIRIRGRFGSEPMQLFANSKNRILAKIRIWCPALHKNRYSPQKLPCRRNFVRRFWICDQKHDSFPQSGDNF